MQLWGLGGTVSSSNGVWGRAPAEIEFGAFYHFNMTFGGSNLTNYRAMHYSAKGGIALARHLSVCLKRWWIRSTCVGNPGN